MRCLRHVAADRALEVAISGAWRHAGDGAPRDAAPWQPRDDAVHMGDVAYSPEVSWCIAAP